MGKIENKFGVAGLMGNLYAESALQPTNLQNSFEKKLGMTDASYTASVDNGVYNNFPTDGAGYGLAQWTYRTRKAALLNYAHAQRASIGDLDMQLGFLWKELTESYQSVVSALKNATSVRAASDAVLLNFERPADQSAAVQAKRASFGQTYYDQYAATEKGSNDTMKILLISGHGAGDPGACATIDGKYYREADLTVEVVDKLAPILREQYGAEVVIYDKSRDAYQDYKAGRLTLPAADYLLEIHFNACVRDLAGNGRTTGTEIYWPSRGKASGKENAILKHVCALGMKNRGAQSMALAVINTAAGKGMPANLLEVCFIDDADDMRLYLKNKDAFAHAIADGVAEACGLKKINTNKEETEMAKIYADIKDIPYERWRKELQELLDLDCVNGGTPREKNATDLNLSEDTIKAIVIMKDYIDKKFGAK